MEASGFKKRLVLSLGEHTYLYLATGTHRLSEGHCYIVPMRHTLASTVRILPRKKREKRMVDRGNTGDKGMEKEAFREAMHAEGIVESASVTSFVPFGVSSGTLPVSSQEITPESSRGRQCLSVVFSLP